MYVCMLSVSLCVVCYSLSVCVLSVLLCVCMFFCVLHSYALGAVLDPLLLVSKGVKAHIKNLIIIDCFCCVIIHQQ